MAEHPELDKLNQLMGQMMADIQYDRAPAMFKFPQGLDYRYWGKFQLITGVWAFCYSTTRNANGKYVSWVYQPLVGRKSWKAGKYMEHRLMRGARARAYKMYNQHLEVQKKYEALYKSRQRRKRK